MPIYLHLKIKLVILTPYSTTEFKIYYLVTLFTLRHYRPTDPKSLEEQMKDASAEDSPRVRFDVLLLYSLILEF